MSTELVPVTPPPSTGVTMYRASTDAASLCKDIVVATAKNIQGKKFVAVEGWEAIAIAHGCAASATDVKRTDDGGFSAIGRVRRMDNGVEIATGEGYVGPDEAVWFGGSENGRTYKKRHDYAIRAMAQTRAISRACRSAFAHVVVMMNAGLSTTPAEEVPPDGFDDRPQQAQRTTVTGKLKAAAAQVDTYTGEVMPDDGWVEPYLDRIANATGTSTLKTEYEAGKKEAMSRKDKPAYDRIVAAKDAKKALLAQAEKPAPHSDAVQAIADMEDDLPFQASK